MISLMRNRVLALVVTTYMIGFIASPAWAAMIPSKGSSGDAAGNIRLDQDINTVQLALENKLVQEKLRAYGLSAEEVKAKLSSMSPSQIHLLAQASDDVLAGGDGLGTVIALLVIIVLVIVILKLLNHDIIIKMTLEDTHTPADALIG